MQANAERECSKLNKVCQYELDFKAMSYSDCCGIVLRRKR